MSYPSWDNSNESTSQSGSSYRNESSSYSSGGYRSYNGDGSSQSSSYGGKRGFNDYSNGNSRDYRSGSSYGSNDRKRSRSGYSQRSGPVQHPPPSTNPFEKNFLSTPSQGYPPAKHEIEQFRAESEMTVRGNDVPAPLLQFSQCPFPAKALDQLVKVNGFTQPTPIQSQGWAIALSGRDVVGIAQTGSGKTLSFILPALIHCKAQPPSQRGDGPVVLVLAPTRELAVQIQQVADEYGRLFNAKSTCVYGGSSKGPQIRSLSYGIDLVVATPGRLLDLVDSGLTNLSKVSFLVLDEADRMLDMGFEEDIRRIISLTRPDRQTLMWSATWPRGVQGLARDFLNDFLQVNIGSEQLVANKKINQTIIICDEDEKEEKLRTILTSIWDDLEGSDDSKVIPKIIVFANTKRACDNLAYKMRKDRWPCNSIHGDKTQTERDLSLHNFKTGDSPILVATDVAARGLDVKDVKFVINFDLPNTIEDYVHRIGRTARGNSVEGTAYTFFTHQNSGLARDLIQILQDANQPVSEELQGMVRGGRSYGGGGRGGRSRGGRFGGGGGGNSGRFGKPRGNFADAPPGNPNGASKRPNFGSQDSAGNGGGRPRYNYDSQPYNQSNNGGWN